MSRWRLARSLEQLRSQINSRWPGRDRSSDGTIGDAAHASRNSDHNPWVKDGAIGIVTAIDITHDPDSGCDAGHLSEALRQSRDARVKYLIFNRRICSGDAGPQPWTWRKYVGSNPHSLHMHLSVLSSRKHYDSDAPWSAVTTAPVTLLSAAREQDEEEGDPKPGVFRRIRNWLVGGSGIGLGFLGYLTDWQVVAVLCLFLFLSAASVIGFAILFFGADTVRAWANRQVS